MTPFVPHFNMHSDCPKYNFTCELMKKSLFLRASVDIIKCFYDVAGLCQWPPSSSSVFSYLPSSFLLSSQKTVT